MRNIVEDSLFATQKRKLKHSARRLDSILDGITWALARKPEQFPRVPDTEKLYLAKTDPFPGAPRMYVWYTFDEKNVYLLSIEEAQE